MSSRNSRAKVQVRWYLQTLCCASKPPPQAPFLREVARAVGCRLGRPQNYYFLSLENKVFGQKVRHFFSPKQKSDFKSPLGLWVPLAAGTTLLSMAVTAFPHRLPETGPELPATVSFSSFLSQLQSNIFRKDSLVHLEWNCPQPPAALFRTQCSVSLLPGACHSHQSFAPKHLFYPPYSQEWTQSYSSLQPQHQVSTGPRRA